MAEPEEHKRKKDIQEMWEEIEKSDKVADKEERADYEEEVLNEEEKEEE